MSKLITDFMANIIAKNPGEIEFHQAVREVAESLLPFIQENQVYKHAKILERIAEPAKRSCPRRMVIAAWHSDRE